MYAPRVFVSMVSVLLTFAVASYWMSGSLWTVLLQTFLCAIILQVGYFIGVLYLVHREKQQRQQDGREIPGDLRAETRIRDDHHAETRANLKISD